MKRVDADSITLWSRDTLRLHLDVVLKNMIVKTVQFTAEDEDWDQSSYAANMETAGFNEPAERLALGGVYNHLMMLLSLGRPDQIEITAPAGPVSFLASICFLT